MSSYAIYQPKNKAAEYSYWACNFYNGCSNGCEYCYCKRGVLKATLGGDVPTLKKCFRDDDDAISIFKKEISLNLEELRSHGLFFSFTTDPMLPETIGLTLRAVHVCLENRIPVKILTKRVDWIKEFDFGYYRGKEKMIAFGVTLTGRDDLEPGASTNKDRALGLFKLKRAGFLTFSSIEPVIDFEDSLSMIISLLGYCDLYKIGLKSGWHPDPIDIRNFINNVHIMIRNEKIYWKDSLLRDAYVDRSELPEYCVSKDYNLFETI